MHRFSAAFLIAAALALSAPLHADEPARSDNPGEVQPAKGSAEENPEDAEDSNTETTDAETPETGESEDSQDPVPEESTAGDSEPAPTDGSADEDPTDEGEPSTADQIEAEAEDAGVEPDEQPQPSPDELELPEDPDARLLMARKAFRRTDYGLLVPLLEPIVGADSPLQRVEDRIAARELLGVGYFFMAQQVTNPQKREELLNTARDVFLDLLREKPEHELDNLVFPVSVVELFEAVRRENAEELEELIRRDQDVRPDGELDTLYIERATVVGIWWLNLLPFGAGQFQNGDVAKGTAFGLLQAGALALNAGSYFAIVGLRNEDGRFDTEGGNDSDLAKALRWRRNLYIGLGTFVGLWVLSAVDGVLNFEAEKVRIRTLDAPPPELGGVSTGTGTPVRLPLGLSFEFDW